MSTNVIRLILDGTLNAIAPTIGNFLAVGHDPLTKTLVLELLLQKPPSLGAVVAKAPKSRFTMDNKNATMVDSIGAPLESLTPQTFYSQATRTWNPGVGLFLREFFITAARLHSSRFVPSNKKAGVIEDLKVFDHAGLLI